MIYGLEGKRPLDLDEIASQLRSTSQHIELIEKKAFRVLRRRFRRGEGGAFLKWLDARPMLEDEATQEEIGPLLGRIPVDGPILLATADVARELLSRAFENPRALLNLSPRRFEELIAEVWRRFGYEVELTSSTRDGGRDIIAVKHAEVSVRYLIECKRYAPQNKVGVVPVRSLFGVKEDEGATKAILATTSQFTAEVLAFVARHRWELEARDYDGIVEWLRFASKKNETAGLGRP
jgi:Restriction endonuclease